VRPESEYADAVIVSPEVFRAIATGADARLTSSVVAMLPDTIDTRRNLCAVVVPVEESEQRYSLCELAVAEHP